MSWQLGALAILALVLVGGFAWFERSRPPARIVAAVAALAALAIAGRVAFAPIPNLVATTDVALLAGYAFGGPPGFAVGALAGLISNFWFGQGPWTPWQMAGWGAVGLAGAGLARVSGRSLGRWHLAFAAGLLGLAYGALMDLSVMVTYGGEQSLDRYLALSARGLPFNLTHAGGNFVLMLTAGPALVRMLDRYRERFSFSWRPAASGSAVAVVIALSMLVSLPAPPPAIAGGGVNAAEKWLRDAQNRDGGFGTEPGASSSPGMTGWAMLGLEAAGVNPRDVRRGGNTPVSYLRKRVGSLDDTGDLSRTILGLKGAGIDPRNFAGHDLVAALRDRRGSGGSFAKQVNLTAFAMLAQRAAGVDQGKLGKSAAWLRAAQKRNGGWGSTRAGWSDPDSTGSAIQALAVAPGGSDHIDRGVRWLKKSQHGTGGWSLTRGAKSNAQSTAWAIQGVIAADRAPSRVRTKGESGIDYLRKRQDADGHYRYSGSSDQTPVWVTAQALVAMSHEALPLHEVKRDPDRKRGHDKGSGGNDDSGGGYSNGGSGYDSGGYDSSGYDGYDSSSNGSGYGGDGSHSGTDPGTGAESSPPTTAERQRIPANEAQGEGPLEVAQVGAEDDPDEGAFEAPATPVLLSGLGGLTALLGGGFLWLRRRVP